MSEDFRKELNKCVRCGKCRAVCPVFEQTLFEGDVARGRINAVMEMDGRPTSKYLDSLFRCLLCGACAEHCPSGVPAADLTRMARAHHRIPLAKRFLHRTVMTDQRRMSKVASAARIAVKLASQKAPDESGLRLRAGLERWLGQRSFEEPSATDLILKRGTSVKKSDTAYFAGCVTTYIGAQIGNATLDVLEALGINADLPAGQACCGLMAYGAGDLFGANKTARNFIDVFADYRRIVVSCASCLDMLKNHLPGLDPRGREVADRIIDIHRFLIGRNLGVNTETASEFNPVAYHAPCHSRFGDNGDRTLELLRLIEGIELVDLPDGCCGFGGSFTIAYPDLSRAIGKRRAAQVAESSAVTVVTSCSGCLLGIYDAVSEMEKRPAVMHPMELIGRLTGR